MDVGTINKYYADGKGYFSYMGFFKLFPKCERFLAGDQWAPPTQATKNKPRPVINIIEPISNHKVSSIINDPIKMVFSPDDQDEADEMAEVGAELFTQYAEVEWDNLDQDELNEDSLRSAVVKGAGIWHYYWDDTVIMGKKRQSKGKLCGEVLDPLNVFVGNPQDTKTQTQPYILITGRKDIEEIKRMAKGNGIAETDIIQIVGDKNTSDEGYDAAQKELKDKANVITLYWKELMPPMAYATIQLIKTCGNIVVMKQVNTQHKLYPIAKINWGKKTKSWYGKGQVEGLINNQKYINYMVAMQMQSAIDTGSPKAMVKAGVTGWDNDTSKVIVDNSGSASWGISYLQPTAISQAVPTLVEFLLTNAKSNAGASESTTGDVSSMSNLSPTVVMALQQQAQVPIESIKTRFKRTLKEVGEILAEFWTINYTTTRVMMIDKIDPNTIDPMTGKGFTDPNTGQEIPPTESKQPQDFKGTDFKDITLKLKINIGTSKTFSDTLTTTSLDQLFTDGIIDGETKIKYYPETAMPFKDQILKDLPEIQARKQQQLMSQIPPQM